MTRSGSTSDEPHARWVPHRQDGVVAPARQADRDDVGHPGTGPAGEQQHVGRCSTWCSRVSVSVGPESLYQTNRQAWANSRASVASRPTTSIVRSPSTPAV